MRERPILFSGAMIRAILAGAKTQTRRAVKRQFAANAEPAEMGLTNASGWQISGHSGGWWDETACNPDEAIRCPYGVPGDRLYARETWAAPHAYDHLPPRLIPRNARIHYAATEDRGGLRWRPSIHMPRWASRITLEVTSVRVERLQDISEADAQAEGASYHDGLGVGHSGWRHDDGAVHDDARSAFARLWCDINGAGSWDANPWVWVVSFERGGGLTMPIKPENRKRDS